MDTHQHTAASLIRSEGKRGLSDEESEEEEYSSEALALEGYGGGEEYGGRRKRVMTDLYSSSKRGGSKAGGGSSGAAASIAPSCQVDGCDSDLSEAKQYHRRHKVCEYHAKAPSVHISGFQQRFCQQCSRFHELSEFDDSKRSCRRRLAGHNERRRKNATD